MTDAQQEVQAQDNIGAEQADAQLVQQEAATTEPVTAQELGEQTVSQSEGLADAVPAQSADIAAVAVDGGVVAPDVQAGLSEPEPVGAAAPVNEAAVQAAEETVPPVIPQAVPLSQTAEHVRAWIELMRLTAPHQSQKAFDVYLDENINSFDEFVAALAATGG
jgi:hypothetical protein